MIDMERLEALKQGIFFETPELSSERARLITESYKETRDLPTMIRRAKAIKTL